MKTKSNIERILESGGFVVTSESGPPRGADAGVMRKKGNRLKELNQLDRYEEIIPVKDWTTSRDGGPRKRVREDLRL